MDLVDYREPSEGVGDGRGNGPGHAAAEELLRGPLDGARVFSFPYIHIQVVGCLTAPEEYIENFPQ